MKHMEVIQSAIQPIIQMDQKEHIEDNGSHEAKSKFDGPCLDYEDNVLNDEDNDLNDDLRLLQGPITRLHAKKFNECLQGFMKNIWANHAYGDSIHFEGFCGSEIEAKWALFNILEVQVFDDYG